MNGSQTITFVASGAVSSVNPLGLVSNAHCLPASGYRIALHAPRGQRLVAATAYVDGRVAARAHGRRVTAVSLGTLIQASQVVKVVARTNRGKLITTVRSFRGCLPVKGSSPGSSKGGAGNGKHRRGHAKHQAHGRKHG